MSHTFDKISFHFWEKESGMNEKLTFNEIIETFESRWFMSVMSTAAVGILTEIIAQKFSFYWLKSFANALVFLAIFLILIIGTIFC